MATVKEEARQLIERLADEASRDDLMYETYVRKKIAMGLEAAELRRLIPHDELKGRFRSKWLFFGPSRALMTWKPYHTRLRASGFRRLTIGAHGGSTILSALR